MRLAYFRSRHITTYCECMLRWFKLQLKIYAYTFGNQNIPVNISSKHGTFLNPQAINTSILTCLTALANRNSKQAGSKPSLWEVDTQYVLWILICLVAHSKSVQCQNMCGVIYGNIIRIWRSLWKYNGLNNHPAVIKLAHPFLLPGQGRGCATLVLIPVNLRLEII